MSKAATIASLVRVAAKNEMEFAQTIQQVLDEGDVERAAEFFDRLNIPRSVGLDDPNNPAGAPRAIVARGDHVESYESERLLSSGIQKFLDRHERKIKWHATHPAMDGVQNVLLLYRCALALTEHRLDRLVLLLKKKEELNPVEWATARELMNHAYLSYRNYLTLFSGEWLDEMLKQAAKPEIKAALGDFYQLVDKSTHTLEAAREKIEERRAQLTVLPGEQFPPVKPPNYFGGDLLGRGPWKQFWTSVLSRTQRLREEMS
jgi:hypothetical protein